MSYESDELLSEYLLMHYGTDEQLMPWGFGPKDAVGFPVRTVECFPQDNVIVRLILVVPWGVRVLSLASRQLM